MKYPFVFLWAICEQVITRLVVAGVDKHLPLHCVSWVSSSNGTRKLGAVWVLLRKQTVNAKVVPESQGKSVSQESVPMRCVCPILADHASWNSPGR